jgi:selenoprotein W-related protein
MAMTEVNIEYCVPCGLLENAIETQETLLEEFGQELDGVRLQPGHGGVFKVYADDDLIWDKDDHDGTIDLKAITEAVHDRAHAHA